MNRMLKYASWSTSPPLTRLLRPAIRRSGAVMGRIVDDVIQARRDGAGAQAQDLLDLMLNSAHPVTGRSLAPDNLRRIVFRAVLPHAESRGPGPGQGGGGRVMGHIRQSQAGLRRCRETALC